MTFFRYIILFLIIAAVTPLAEAAIDIWVPRPHNTAFMQPEGTFVAEVRALSSLNANGWSASLNNDLLAWPCTVLSAVYSTIHHNTESGWRLTISVSANIPPELMDLNITHTTAGSDIANRSVNIVSDFESDFYILHTSDQHVTAFSAIAANGNSHPTYKNGSTESMGWAVPVINLINPRFVVYTGDNLVIYYDASSWSGMTEARNRCRMYLTALSQYKVPTLVTTGNHDIGFSDYVSVNEWRNAYEEEFGQRSFSFNMGSFYVLTNEWSSNEFLNWAKNDYAAAYANQNIKYRLITQHYYDGLSGWTTVAGSSNPCNLTLVGHNHAVRTLQTTPYLVYSSGTGQDYQRSGFYDFRRTQTGWNCMQASSHVNNIDVFRLFGDWGNPGKVRSTFAFANNGTEISNTAEIINDLPQDFYNGRVRFLMKKGNYRLIGGDIEAQYDYAGGTKTAVVAKVNIRKNTTSSVSIEKYVSLEDLSDFASWWLYSNCVSYNDCDGADLYKDGTVNFIDFGDFAAQW
ncbi:MAG: hypothetical protein A2Y10_00465 [Planctomycetes bacterium GWF2_41_51]|nr:MAG: hypothetical protein A2Y10_00465 [Planctomycetes bacterium GWF2_41_51]HBG26100.1 hypothetical protein [Phycisphaerales bacterium]